MMLAVFFIFLSGFFIEDSVKGKNKLHEAFFLCSMGCLGILVTLTIIYIWS